MSTTKTESLCIYEFQCSGCQLLHLNYPAQEIFKKNHLQSLLEAAQIPAPPTGFLSAGEAFLRDRLDFSFHHGALGLYAKNKREVLDLETCAQLSPGLQNALTRFRKIQWPVEKASFRLRVDPQGRVGAWIDMANIDIKKLLDEKRILQDLMTWAFVEIGQRRKVPVWKGSEFKLQDPQMNPWFETFMEGVAIPLFCQVASFTQPSLKANHLIGETISQWVARFQDARVLEFGSGIGNLTFPALATAKSVTACEIDELSLEGLAKTAENLPGKFRSKKNDLHIFRGDFQRKLSQDFAQFDLVLANPPRSGLMNFLNPLEALSADKRPEAFIYMSCFPESLVQDLTRLKECGYEIAEISILDQFPQTNHYEVLTLLQRKKT